MSEQSFSLAHRSLAFGEAKSKPHRVRIQSPNPEISKLIEAMLAETIPNGGPLSQLTEDCFTCRAPEPELITQKPFSSPLFSPGMFLGAGFSPFSPLGGLTSLLPLIDREVQQQVDFALMKQELETLKRKVIQQGRRLKKTQKPTQFAPIELPPVQKPIPEAKLTGTSGWGETAKLAGVFATGVLASKFLLPKLKSL